MPGWESPQEKDVVDQSISNGRLAVAAGHNTLADEINRKEQDQNNYLTMLDYNFCKTVVSEWTKGRVQDQKSSGLRDRYLIIGYLLSSQGTASSRKQSSLYLRKQGQETDRRAE